MTKETLQLIGNSWRNALENCSELEQIPYQFADNMQSLNIGNELEKRQLEKYISQIRKSGDIRQHTQELTDLMENVIFTMQHLLIWRNSLYNDNSIYSGFFCRRKGLESEYAKSLQKTYEDESPKIKDFLACRYIVDTAKSELKNIEYTYELANIFIEIFCNDNPKAKSEFINWIQKNYKKDKKTITRIMECLSIPFELCDAEQPKDLGFDPDKHPDIIIPTKSGILDCYKYGIKDYLIEPKEKGYQSLHFILQISPTSPIFPGTFIEFQGRTLEIHARCEDKKALSSWKNHKESHIDKEILKVFEISDFSNIHINGYYNNSKGYEVDLTGLRNAVIPNSRNAFNSH